MAIFTLETGTVFNFHSTEGPNLEPMKQLNFSKELMDSILHISWTKIYLDIEAAKKGKRGVDRKKDNEISWTRVKKSFPLFVAAELMESKDEKIVKSLSRRLYQLEVIEKAKKMLAETKFDW